MSSREQATRDLESILDATRHTGFKLIMKEYQLMLNQLTQYAADHCDTSEKWFQRRGEIAMLRKFLQTEDDVLAAIDELPNQVFDGETPPEASNDLED